MRPFRIYLLLLSAATLLAAATALPRPPLDEPDLPTLNALLPHVAEVPQRPRVLGYSRAEFGPGWAPAASCTVREKVLIDAGATLSSCHVTAGTTRDPYTGQALDLREGVEIDHIFPLSAAWDLGAHRWSLERRVAFANDPRNLVVTSRSANQAKSDLLPAAWKPEDPRARCWYGRRLALVAAVYELPIPVADKVSVQAACRMDAVTRLWLGWSLDF
ncbi:MAG: HNH endonuclease family protein [Corynebacterium sp.]|uniref:HNH endonuclease family protein n=1 Tax=Corynebacterium sp. TaxID=1720 RepID=UPI0026E0CCF4|nr:HNH endonuclease family protein [Corynebacterium sp.]MDO5670601.1 HNH endonuclease family protein [Corynebacterium sp.]